MLLYKSDCINGFIEYGKPWKQAFVAPGNKKLPIKSDEESSLVDYMSEISNLDLVRSMIEFVDYSFPRELTPIKQGLIKRP
jgi:hypothetical protein